MTRVNLPPFIVTLGTFSIFTAIPLLYAQGQTVSLDPNAFLLLTGKSFSIGSVSITFGVILMVPLFVVRRICPSVHGLGAALYATGDDQEAASLAGISTRKVLFSAYVVAGLCVGDRRLDRRPAGLVAPTRTPA